MEENPPAGIAYYTFYYSTNGGPWTAIVPNLIAPNTTINFTGRATPAIVLQHRDGLREQRRDKAAGTEASTYVPDLTPPVTSVTAPQAPTRPRSTAPRYLYA